LRGVDWLALPGHHVAHLAGIAHAGRLPTGDLHQRRAREESPVARGKVAFVFLSSVRAQAGLSAERPITEKDAPAPTDAYGRAKLEGERLLAKSGVPFTVLRPAVVYGKGVKGNIAALTTLARTPMPLPFAGLDNRRSLLALDNLVSALALALGARDALNETFLVADAEPISVADLVSAMREGLGRAPHLVKMRLGAVKRLMQSFGREADWERISGAFFVDVSKLMGMAGARDRDARNYQMMRSGNGTA
jgi:UDP-glucose 4-epimerase